MYVVSVCMCSNLVEKKKADNSRIFMMAKPKRSVGGGARGQRLTQGDNDDDEEESRNS